MDTPVMNANAPEMAADLHVTSTTISYSDAGIYPDYEFQYNSFYRVLSIIHGTLDPIDLVVLVVGIPANVLSIRAFIRMGLKDCVTISFFHMAISDLCFLALSPFDLQYLHMLVRYIFWRMGIYNYILYLGFDPFEISGVALLDVQPMFVNVSSYFVAFLAIQRSLCVVRPLQFKNMFTPGLTFVVVTFIWSYWLACTLMLVSHYGITEWTLWYGYNSSRAITSIGQLERNKYSAFTYCMFQYTQFMNNVILQATCVVIVLVSLVTLAVALMKSMVFRQAVSSTGAGSAQAQAREATAVAKVIANDNKASPSSSSSSNDRAATKKKRSALSGSKEKQAILQVSILSLVFLVAKIPVVARFLLLSASVHLSGEVDYLLRRFYTTFSVVNASINFFVYYKYNTKFRDVCFQKKC